jgi:hypothetical protein
MLATFNGTWDWTAVGTLTLAVATFVSLFFARNALKKTQAQIELGQAQLKQTQQEIELSRKEVEQAHRPVLVPVADTNQDKAVGNTIRSGPQVLLGGVLGVPVQNIGSGPALRIEAAIEPINPIEGGPWGGLPIARIVPGMGVSELFVLEFTLRGIGEVPAFNLALTYEDVAGNRWTTAGHWMRQPGVYTDLTITALEQGPPTS